MNISVCITVFNEQDSIGPLLDSLLKQAEKPKEIIIVDGGSRDKTIEIIMHYQKKDKAIKLLIENCSRARGRNIACETAKNEIVAMTDAGCIPKTDWLEKITDPFKLSEVDVVAGFYKMSANNEFEKAESVFLGVTPDKFNMNFLPSTRSVAFRKSIWENVGGFPEKLKGSAEDTVFNYKLVQSGARISRMKNAVVEWGMPETLSEFFNKIKGYAEGDAKSKIWIFPGKGLASHNIHSLIILLRYLFFVILFILGFGSASFWLLDLACITAYLIWSYRKAGMWGPILQITSDFAVMSGFIRGIL